MLHQDMITIVIPSRSDVRRWLLERIKRAKLWRSYGKAWPAADWLYRDERRAILHAYRIWH